MLTLEAAKCAFSLYKCFCVAGFSEDQAMTLLIGLTRSALDG